MAGTAYPFSALILPMFLFLFRAFEGRRGDKPASSGRLRRDLLARYAPSEDRLRCTVMDWRPEDDTLTLVVFQDTRASLLLLPEGNTIGYDVGAELGPTKRFVAAVARAHDRMTATRHYPVPPPGHARFWTVRPNVTLTSDDVWIEDIQLGITEWTGAWGSGFAAVREIIEESKRRQTEALRRQGHSV